MDHNKIFFPQEILDEWILTDKIKIENDILTLLSEEKSYKIEPSVHFISESTGERDKNDLIGKVKTKKKIEQLGADLYFDSVIIGDNAYKVVTGFLGTPISKNNKENQWPIEENEQNLLEKFLMENLK